MDRIYLDTFIFMDILSGDRDLAAQAKEYIQMNACVSSIVLTELAYHIGRKKPERVNEVLLYIQASKNIKIVPVTEEIASMAGKLRVKYKQKIQKKLTYFDCIHLATAIIKKCTKFVTGDKGFDEVEEIATEIY